MGLGDADAEFGLAEPVGALAKAQPAGPTAGPATAEIESRGVSPVPAFSA